MLSIQYHAPVTGLVDQISSDRSTAALSLIGLLKVTMIGMPTPTISFRVIVVEAVNPRAGRKVRNVLASVVCWPCELIAVAVTR